MMPTQLRETVTTQLGVEFWAQSSDAECTGCAFRPGGAECMGTACVPYQRADRSHVIWVKAE